MVTFVLAATIFAVLAADVPLPVEMSALVMVGLILRVYIIRENSAQRDHAARLAALEAEVSEQRHLKHLVINKLTTVIGTLALVQAEADRCTCGAVTSVLPLINKVLNKEGDPS